MAKVKLVQAVTYKKFTEVTEKKEIIDLINKSHVIYLKSQSIYDDNSQKMMIELNWKNK